MMSRIEAIFHQLNEKALIKGKKYNYVDSRVQEIETRT